MKRTITSLILMTFGLLLFSTAVMAQQYDVPGTYATIEAAFEQINTDITGDPSITEVTISVAEGTIVETGMSNGVTHPSIKVTIQGAGADKSFIESFRGDRIVPGEPDSLSTRWIEITSADSDSVEYTIQDLTIRYFGRGDNDNGGVFSTSTSKAFYVKMMLTNVVFDRCGAKQGAIWHGANGTHEFVMDNCLIIDCVTYGGSAFAGAIGVDNGGVITITNCTFMNNIMNPYDHRSDSANAIDVGAGRGGVIKVADGTIRNVPEPYPYSPLFFTLENCAFINNLVNNNAVKNFPAVSDSIHPLMTISLKDTAACEITIVDNIFIGNRRTGYETTDVDLVIGGPWEEVFFTGDGNIMNTMLSMDTYNDTLIDGFIVNPELTYTHQWIQFTMEGDLPKLIPDADAIGHVEFAGNGDGTDVQDFRAFNVDIYPNPSSGLFEVTLPEGMKNSTYEVFSITGSLMRSGVFYNNHQTLDLTGAAKGMYILRMKNDSQTSTKRVIIK